MAKARVLHYCFLNLVLCVCFCIQMAVSLVCHKEHQTDHLNCKMLHHYVSVCEFHLAGIHHPDETHAAFCLFASVGVLPVSGNLGKNPTQTREQRTNWTLKGLNIKPRTF